MCNYQYKHFFVITLTSLFIARNYRKCDCIKFRIRQPEGLKSSLVLSKKFSITYKSRVISIFNRCGASFRHLW